MYNVTVLREGHSVDAIRFPFGQWEEIGFWLDSAGYNDPRFTVQITFTEELTL